ncbi:hypothetical protein IMSAG192_00964 [Muribaculaceae bacterium]|nr:hypothetical protein IMSAG192_00964 [Muribaculaceae bacterium]
MVFLSGRGCVKYERLAHERPVDRHGILKGSDGGAFDTQVCVAPYAGSGPVDISVGDIHSTYISDATVDYGEFPVVAPVDACREMWECDSEERVYLYAGFLHLSEEAVGCVERADMVVYKSYFHSLPGFAHQCVGNGCADGVVFDYIVLHQHIAVCGIDVSKQSIEFGASVGEDIYLVAGVVYRSLECLGHAYLLMAFGCERERLYVDGRV